MADAIVICGVRSRELFMNAAEHIWCLYNID